MCRTLRKGRNMNRGKTEALKEFTVIQMNHWALFPIYLLINSLFGSFVPCDDPNAGIWLAAGLLPFLFYFFRVRIHHFLLLAASHGAGIFLFPFLIPCETGAGRLVYVLTGISYGAYSIFLRLRKTDFMDGEILMPVAVGLSLMSSILVHYRGIYEWDSSYILALIGVFGLYFVSSYLKSYLRFLAVNKSSTGHIPEKEIFISGSRLVILFSALAMGALFLVSHFEWLQAILRFLKKIIVLLLRFLFSLLPEGNSQPVPSDIGGPVLGDGFELPPPGDSFFLWTVLEVLAVSAFLIFAFSALYKALKRLVAFVLKRMAYHPSKEESSAGKVIDVREKCSEEKKTGKSEKTAFWKTFTPAERIRKLYRKHILAARRMKNLIPGSRGDQSLEGMTARDWGKLLEEPDMPVIYEKARYSHAECTAEDLRHMREACK